MYYFFIVGLFYLRHKRFLLLSYAEDTKLLESSKILSFVTFCI